MTNPRSESPKRANASSLSDDGTGAARRRDSFQLDTRQFLQKLLAPILVDGRPHFDPAGAIVLSEAETIWTWLERDVSPNMSDMAKNALQADADPDAIAKFARTIVETMAAQMRLAGENPEFGRRVRVQIGDDDAYSHLNHTSNGFRCQPYLEKASSFGHALNLQRDDQAIAVSLNSFPARKSPLMPMLMFAAMGQVENPTRIVTVITQLAGGMNERALTQSGFDSLLDALTAHAQHQLSLIHAEGRFTDMDLACRALGRFHMLIRSISIVGETDLRGRWAMQSAKLVSHISDQLAPRLHRIEAEVRQALRPSRTEAGGFEADLVLEALNGLYLLIAVREARDSLGVNSALETAWSQTGQVLETLISRNLEAYKAEPENELVAKRLDAAIKMARIRFNPEYADVISRAMQGASRRSLSSDAKSAVS